jgi:hypothetical protein
MPLRAPQEGVAGLARWSRGCARSLYVGWGDGHGPLREIEADGEHHHRDADVLEALLDDEGGLVVKDAVPQRVLLEDELAGDDQALGVLP